MPPFRAGHHFSVGALRLLHRLNLRCDPPASEFVSDYLRILFPLLLIVYVSEPRRLVLDGGQAFRFFEAKQSPEVNSNDHRVMQRPRYLSCIKVGTFVEYPSSEDNATA